MSEKSTLVKSRSGATSRSKAPDYTLCPKEVIADIIERFQFGLEQGHARNNWKLGKNDPEFIRERINHAQHHFQKVLEFTATKKDFQAVLCNLAMVSWWLRNGNGLKELMPNLYE